MPMIDGKKVKSRFASLKLNELSSVDRPANALSMATIMKRDDTPADTPLIATAIAKYVGSEDGAHTFDEVLAENEFSQKIWPLTDAFTQAMRSIMGDRAMTPKGREAKVTESVTQFLNSVRAISPGDAEEVEKRFARYIRKGMDDMKTVEQLEGELATLKAQMADKDKAVADAKADKDKAEKALTDEQTAHAETKKSLAEATDEVIKVNGNDVRKSLVGDASFAVFKSLQDDASMSRLEKRASEEFPSLPGTATEKALVLKAVDGMSEDVKKSFNAMMTAAEATASQAFKRFGFTTTESTVDVAKAASDFAGKVSEIEKRDGISKAQATSKARTEFPAEFAAAYPDQAAA